MTRTDGRWFRRAAFLMLAGLCLGHYGCGEPGAPDAGSPQAEESLSLAELQIPGEVTAKEEPLVDRAKRVFGQLVRTYRTIPRPQLKIVDYIDSDPLAFATADRWIVLSLGALRFCYDSGDKKLGDARLGLVLSHELAHLESNHFLHQQLYETVRRTPVSRQEKLKLAEALRVNQEEERSKEVEADEQGLIHLTLAGFEARRLVDDTGFLHDWGSQLSGTLAFSALSPDQRTSLLRGTIRKVADHIPYFQLGTRLYQLGRYDEARLLLESFARQFAGPAVLNNLGLCHYQIAAKLLSRCDDQSVVRFKLPTLLASTTIADRLVGRGPSSDCLKEPEFMRHKREAENYFRNAQDLDEDFLPAFINHLSLMLLTGEGSGTLARLYDIFDKDPGYADLELLRVLGTYLRSPDLIDREALIRKLKKLRSSRPDSADVSYDLARILQESGRAEAAKEEWKRFLELEPEGPYADYVREQLYPETGRASRPSVPPPPPPRPLGPVDDATRTWLAELSRPVRLRSEDLELDLYENETLRVLLRKNELVLIARELEGPLSGEEIRARYGPPLNRVAATLGDFLAYEGFGFDVVDGAAHRIVYFGDDERQ